MRLFVSVDLDEIAPAVADLQQAFGEASGVRLTDPTQTHVTLKFLGDASDAQLPEIQQSLDAAVAAAAVEPFTVTVTGVGAFPSEGYISVIWVGVETEPSGVLSRLHEEIESRLVAIGFDPADHEFTPHATIARMDHAGGKERVQRLLDSRDPVVGSQAVDAIHLTESTLTDDGPEYTHRYTISLA